MLKVQQKHVKNVIHSFLWEEFLDEAFLRGRRLLVLLFSDAALIRGGV